MTDLPTVIGEYMQGFNEGYNGYEKKLGGQMTFPDQKANLVFNRVYNAHKLLHTEGQGNLPIFPLIADEILDEIENRIGELTFYPRGLDQERLPICGRKGGEYLRAWELVLLNPAIFEPMFEKQSKIDRTNDNGHNLDEDHFPEIFKKGSFALFNYLMHEFSQMDNAKVSTLYHYFKAEQLLVAGLTQKKYLEFTNEVYGIKPSKIFQKNHTTYDYLKETLPRLKDVFQKRKSSETN